MVIQKKNNLSKDGSQSSSSSLGLPTIFFKNKSVMTFKQLSKMSVVPSVTPKSFALTSDKKSLYSEKMLHRLNHVNVSNSYFEEQKRQVARSLQSRNLNESTIEKSIDLKRSTINPRDQINKSSKDSALKRQNISFQTQPICNNDESKRHKASPSKINLIRNLDREFTLRDETFLNNPFLFEQSNEPLKKNVNVQPNIMKAFNNKEIHLKMKDNAPIEYSVSRKVTDLIELKACNSIVPFKTKSISELLSEIDNRRLNFTNNTSVISSRAMDQRFENIKRLLGDENSNTSSTLDSFNINNLSSSITHSIGNSVVSSSTTMFSGFGQSITTASIYSVQNPITTEKVDILNSNKFNNYPTSNKNSFGGNISNFKVSTQSLIGETEVKPLFKNESSPTSISTPSIVSKNQPFTFTNLNPVTVKTSETNFGDVEVINNASSASFNFKVENAKHGIANLSTDTESLNRSNNTLSGDNRKSLQFGKKITQNIGFNFDIKTGNTLPMTSLPTSSLATTTEMSNSNIKTSSVNLCGTSSFLPASTSATTTSSVNLLGTSTSLPTQKSVTSLEMPNSTIKTSSVNLFGTNSFLPTTKSMTIAEMPNSSVKTSSVNLFGTNSFLPTTISMTIAEMPNSSVKTSSVNLFGTSSSLSTSTTTREVSNSSIKSSSVNVFGTGSNMTKQSIFNNENNSDNGPTSFGQNKLLSNDFSSNLNDYKKVTFGTTLSERFVQKPSITESISESKNQILSQSNIFAFGKNNFDDKSKLAETVVSKSYDQIPNKTNDSPVSQFSQYSNIKRDFGYDQPITAVSTTLEVNKTDNCKIPSGVIFHKIPQNHEIGSTPIPVLEKNNKGIFVFGKNNIDISENGLFGKNSNEKKETAFNQNLSNKSNTGTHLSTTADIFSFGKSNVDTSNFSSVGIFGKNSMPSKNVATSETISEKNIFGKNNTDQKDTVFNQNSFTDSKQVLNKNVDSSKSSGIFEFSKNKTEKVGLSLNSTVNHNVFVTKNSNTVTDEVSYESNNSLKNSEIFGKNKNGDNVTGNSIFGQNTKSETIFGKKSDDNLTNSTNIFGSKSPMSAPIESEKLSNSSLPETHKNSSGYIFKQNVNAESNIFKSIQPVENVTKSSNNFSFGSNQDNNIIGTSISTGTFQFGKTTNTQNNIFKPSSNIAEVNKFLPNSENQSKPIVIDLVTPSSTFIFDSNKGSGAGSNLFGQGSKSSGQSIFNQKMVNDFTNNDDKTNENANQSVTNRTIIKRNK